MSTIEASLQLEIAQYQAALKKAQSQIEGFKNKAQRAGSEIERGMFGGMSQRISAFGGMLSGSLMGAVTVQAIKAQFTAMDDLVDASMRLGETAETLQRVEFASKQLASVDMNGLVSSFLKLERSLGDIENKSGAQALERYGITAANLAKVPLDQKITMLADAFQKARSEGTGYYDITQLLGRSAGDLIPLLETSSDKLREMFAEAPVVAESQVQYMAAINDQIDAALDKEMAGMREFLGMAAMGMQAMFDGQKTFTGMIQEASAAAKEQVQGLQNKRDQASAALEEQRQDRDNKIAEEEVRRIAAMQSRALAEEARLREQIAEIQRRARLDSLPPQERALEIQREISRMAIEFGRRGPETEAARLEIEKKILQLRNEQAAAEKQAAEEAQAEADRTADAEQRLEVFRQELEIAEARARGEDDLADSMQRQLDIAQLKARLMEEMKLSEEEALALAERQVDAQAEINAEKSKGSGRYDSEGRRADGRRKIQGYSRERQGGAEEASARAQARIAEARQKREIPSGLDVFNAQPGLRDRMAGGGMFPGLEGAFGPGGTHAANPLAENAAANAAKADQPTTGGVEGKFDELIAVVQQGLLGDG